MSQHPPLFSRLADAHSSTGLCPLPKSDWLIMEKGKSEWTMCLQKVRCQGYFGLSQWEEESSVCTQDNQANGVHLFPSGEFILPLFWTKYCDIGPNSLTFLDCSGVCCNDPQPHSSPYWRSCAKWRSVTWFFIKHSSWTSDRCHFQTSKLVLLSSESNWAI